jgi:lipopolysaccharide export system protein LptA
MVCGGLLLFIPRPAAGPLGALLTVLCLTAAATTWRDAASMRVAAQPALPASKSPAPLSPAPLSPAPLSPAPVVTATTGLVTIESDRQMADNSTGIVTAIGNVRIVYPDQRVVATARQAQYFSREGRVVLSGQVSVIQDDGHSLRAEQLVYLVNQERLEARPAAGQQVLSRYNLAAPTPSSPASGDRR